MRISCLGQLANVSNEITSGTRFNHQSGTIVGPKSSLWFDTSRSRCRKYSRYHYAASNFRDIFQRHRISGRDRLLPGSRLIRHSRGRSCKRCIPGCGAYCCDALGPRHHIERTIELSEAAAWTAKMCPWRPRASREPEARGCRSCDRSC